MPAFLKIQWHTNRHARQNNKVVGYSDRTWRRALQGTRALVSVWAAPPFQVHRPFLAFFLKTNRTTLWIYLTLILIFCCTQLQDGWNPDYPDRWCNEPFWGVPFWRACHLHPCAEVTVKLWCLNPLRQSLDRHLHKHLCLNSSLYHHNHKAQESLLEIHLSTITITNGWAHLHF